jgi:hypothetical protein
VTRPLDTGDPQCQVNLMPGQGYDSTMMRLLITWSS